MCLDGWRTRKRKEPFVATTTTRRQRGMSSYDEQASRQSSAAEHPPPRLHRMTESELFGRGWTDAAGRLDHPAAPQRFMRAAAPAPAQRREAPRNTSHVVAMESWPSGLGFAEVAGAELQPSTPRRRQLVDKAFLPATPADALSRTLHPHPSLLPHARHLLGRYVRRHHHGRRARLHPQTDHPQQQTCSPFTR